MAESPFEIGQPIVHCNFDRQVLLVGTRNMTIFDECLLIQHQKEGEG